VPLCSPDLDQCISVTGDDRRIEALIEVVSSAGQVSCEASQVAP